MPLRFDNIGIQRKMLSNDSLTFFDMFPQLKNQKRDIAFPFIIYLGNVNNTEYGETPGQVNISDFTTFKKIFTGKDTNLAIWENSTTLVKTSDTTAKRTYEVGRYVYLYRTGKTTTNIISPTNEIINAIQQESETDITFILDGKSFSKNDLFKLWIIPTQGTNEFFLISRITEYVDSNNPDKIIYTEISFTSLNDKLSSSGQQLEQYVNLGAPGEGYAFPKIIHIENIEKSVMLDPLRLQNRGATEIQIEIFGPAIITAFWAMGRRAGKNSFEIIAPRHLFSYKTNSPFSTDFNQKTSAESSYYYLQQGEVDLVAFFQSWKENIRASYDYTATRNYEGYIATYKTAILSTNNPDNSIYKQNFNVWDRDWNINILPYKDWPNRDDYKYNEIDTRAVRYAGDSIIYPDNANISTHLMLNAISYLDVEKLPVSVKESTVWTVKQIPIIGFFANALTLGYPFGWENTTSKIQAKRINGLIPKSLYDFSSLETETGGDEGALAMDIFRANTPDTVGGIVGTNAIGSTLNISLTEKVSLKDGTEVDTLDLGQEEGWLMTGDEVPVNPILESNDGYVIDFINFKIVGKSDIKITAYRYGASIWSGYFQSRSKFTSSIREWSNSIKLSAWEEIDNNIATYPKAIPDPPTISEEFNNIIIPNKTIFSPGIITNLTLYKWNNYDYIWTIYDFGAEGFSWDSFKELYTTFTYSAGEGEHNFFSLYNENWQAETNLLDISIFEIENEEKEILYQNDISGSGNYTQSCKVDLTSGRRNYYNFQKDGATMSLIFTAYRVGNVLYGKLHFDNPWLTTSDINWGGDDNPNSTCPRIDQVMGEDRQAISNSFNCNFEFVVRSEVDSKYNIEKK